MLKPIGIRVNDKTAKFLSDNFRSQSGGARWIVEWAYHAICPRIAVLSKSLEKDELVLVVEAFKDAHQHFGWANCNPGVLAAFLRSHGFHTQESDIDDIDAATIVLFGCGYWRTEHNLSIEEYIDSF